MLVQLGKCEDGAPAIEFCLVATLISIVCIMAFLSLGLDFSDILTTATDAMAGR